MSIIEMIVGSRVSDFAFPAGNLPIMKLLLSTTAGMTNYKL